MASSQRSLFILTTTQDGAGVVTPSAARELPKGSQLLGAQIIVSFTTFTAPAAVTVVIQGRNGTTGDDWVDIFQAISPDVKDAGPFNFILGGDDQLIPIAQFAECRLTMTQTQGVPGDLVDLSVTAHCKSDYLTG